MIVKMTEFGKTSAAVLYEGVEERDENLFFDNELLYTIYFGGNYDKWLFSLRF